MRFLHHFWVLNNITNYHKPVLFLIQPNNIIGIYTMVDISGIAFSH